MINKFVISGNSFLTTPIQAYFHQYYTGYKQPDNPDFINTLKNTFNSESTISLEVAKNKVIDILLEDVQAIIKEQNINNFVLICVPRAKILESYRPSQLMLKEAVQAVAGVVATDGTNYIKRIVDTKTTHLRNAVMSVANDGPEPYPGITVNTCKIDKKNIFNKNIILIDDIYTKSVNIDEDCIQALLDNGAKKVIFYSIAFTRRLS